MIAFANPADFCRAVIILARGHIGDRPGMPIRASVADVERGIWRVLSVPALRPPGVTDEMVEQVKQAWSAMAPHALGPLTAAAVIEVGMLGMTAAAHAELGSRAA